MFHPSGAHLHHVLWAVHTVVTHGRIVRSNLTQEPPETAVSGEDLYQAVREDTVASSRYSKRGLTAEIAACPTLFQPDMIKEKPGWYNIL